MPRKPKEYEVDRILKAVVSYKRSRNIQWKYYVKWKGYSDKRNTWEPEESFESSPALLEKFWKKVDTGGRDIHKASAFALREELMPKDETWSDDDAEGEEDDEQPEKDGESASAQTGKKRSAGATKVTPKRKRGRPSKADKEAGEIKAVEEVVQESPESAENTNPSSDQPAEKQTYAARVAKIRFMTRRFAILSSDSEGEETIVKATEGKESIGKPRERETKPVSQYEEDHSGNSEIEASSHAGSLFSEDEDAENESTDEGKIAEGWRSDAAAPKPTDVSIVTAAPTLEHLKGIKNPTIKRSGKPIRRVQMLDDPEFSRAIQMRVQRGMNNQPVHRTEISQSETSFDKVSCQSTSFDYKGYETATQPYNADLSSPVEPSTPPVPPLPSLPTTDEGTQELLSFLLAAPQDSREVLGTLEAGSVGTGDPAVDATGTSPDLPPLSEFAGSLQPIGEPPLENLDFGPSLITE